jgi:hypothetical protein
MRDSWRAFFAARLYGNALWEALKQARGALRMWVVLLLLRI